MRKILLLFCLLLTGAAWAEVTQPTITEDVNNPVLYKIGSFDRGGYLTYNGESANVTHETLSFYSLWYFMTNGDGVSLIPYSDPSVKLASHSSATAEGAVWYIDEVPNDLNPGYFSISLNADFSGNCLDASNGGSSVGYWTPQPDDYQGTSWSISPVGEEEVASLKDAQKTPSFKEAVLKVNSTCATTITPATAAEDNDHWYIITQSRDGESPIYDNGLSKSIMRAAASTTVASLDGQLLSDNLKYLVRFFAVEGEDLYNMQFATGDFIGSGLTPAYGGGTYAFYKTTEDGEVFGWNVNSKEGTRIDNNGAGNNVLFYGQGINTATSGNNVWKIYPVELQTNEEEVINVKKASLQAAIAATSAFNIGEGFGQYSSEGIAEALAAANAAVEAEDATIELLTEAADNLKAAVDALTLNLPKAGQLLRIRSARTDAQPYLGSENSTAKDQRAAFVMDKEGENELATIFYYDGQTLTNLATGYHLENTPVTNNNPMSYYNGITEGTIVSFQAATNGAAGKYNVIYNNGTRSLFTQKSTVDEVDYYFTDAAGGPNTPTDNVAYTFTLEEVDSIPVTIDETGMATLYAPVALTAPKEVKAYAVSALNEATDEKPEAEVVFTFISGNIPACTGVVLQAAAAGTYNFAIADEAAEVTSLLTGSVATESHEAGTLYTFSIDPKAGFYLTSDAGDVQGCTAYLPASEATDTTTSYVFDQGVLSGIATAAPAATTSAATYDLSGRQVSKATRGLYIVGGQKVLVK